MKVRGHYLGVKDMKLEEIEKWIEYHIWDSTRYSKHDLEVNDHGDEGYITIWLDDCDWEEHLMDIYPTKSELKLIDKKGICGKKPYPSPRKCVGSPKYTLWGKTCSKCRECFNFQEE